MPAQRSHTADQGHLVVASWNVHSGVDGWGRPFDVVAGCQSIDADVLVLQETWSAEGGESLARKVGEALGYRVEESPIARGMMFAPPRGARRGWGPFPFGHAPYGTRVERARLMKRRRRTGRGAATAGRGAATTGRGAATTGGGAATTGRGAATTGGGPVTDRRLVVESGTIGLAVLSRLELGSVEVWDLGQRRRDPTRRCALAVEVSTGGRDPVLVVGTHLSHLRHASLQQLKLLRSLIAGRAGGSGREAAAALVGDLNLPASVLPLLMPGWRRVVRARTWPAWRPIAQSDHILVTPGIAAGGEVLAVAGSDHLPVRARLVWT
ncbi:MAG TPA: endonuclease/exonuclease/phosphatase family protein [Acidimicrobiales bacterium]|nr:endonuclease/exonuclease/phosphatase family protein [Acidimicrobiales bacterium]